MPRQTKLDDAIKKLLCDAIQLGNPVQVACDYAGINPDTFYDWMKRGEAGESPYSEFSDEINRSRGRGAVNLSNRIEQASKDGNWFAAAWKLTHGVYKHLYRENDQAEAQQDQADQILIRAAERTRQRLRDHHSKKS